jgi:Arc/MetJ-type ribon-helix-helix transcriptional regulator
MSRVKVSISVDPTLLRAVDEFVQTHPDSDRSKVIDRALSLWSAAQQEEAMIAQYSPPPTASDEHEAWRSVRRRAAGDRLRRR